MEISQMEITKMFDIQANKKTTYLLQKHSINGYLYLSNLKKKIYFALMFENKTQVFLIITAQD